MRTADYDRIAARYDNRYLQHEYAGVRDALLHFVRIESAAVSVLEVGCGTGHWLSVLEASMRHSPGVDTSERPTNMLRDRLCGVEPSREMVGRARTAAPRASLVRGAAEALPWRDATFDRVYCVNALHHFSNRIQFFAEARRVLKPGGGLLSVGKDPHTDRDSWWVYDYFPETVAIDRERFARVRTLRGELTASGFAWAESFECDHIVASISADAAFAAGVVDRAYTSQLAVLSDDEWQAGVARIRAANERLDGALQLTTDFFLFATLAWV